MSDKKTHYCAAGVTPCCPCLQAAMEDCERTEKDLAEAVAALKECAEYTQDLREAWRRGAISSNDGGSARRSNMNVELNTKLNAFLAKHK